MNIDNTALHGITELYRVANPFTLIDIELELERAIEKHGTKIFNSKHEGYAVLLEEVLELQEAVFKDFSVEEMRKEAIQVAAMAIRFINELTN